MSSKESPLGGNTDFSNFTESRDAARLSLRPRSTSSAHATPNSQASGPNSPSPNVLKRDTPSPKQYSPHTKTLPLNGMSPQQTQSRMYTHVPRESTSNPQWQPFGQPSQPPPQAGFNRHPVSVPGNAYSTLGTVNENLEMRNMYGGHQQVTNFAPTGYGAPMGYGGQMGNVPGNLGREVKMEVDQMNFWWDQSFDAFEPGGGGMGQEGFDGRGGEEQNGYGFVNN